MKCRGIGVLANYCVSLDFFGQLVYQSENLLIKNCRIYPFLLPAVPIRGRLTVNFEHRSTLSDIFQHSWCMR